MNHHWGWMGSYGGGRVCGLNTGDVELKGWKVEQWNSETHSKLATCYYDGIGINHQGGKQGKDL